MATKSLTQERLKELLRYDPETGIFTWLQPSSRFSMIKPGQQAGCLHKRGYIHIKVDGNSYKAHRLAWLYTYGRWPNPAIDHINRNKTDNRLANLREADQLVNMQNKGLYKNNKSGYIGVCQDASGRWVAQLQTNGINKFLGRYDTAEKAAAAYVIAKQTTFLRHANADL